MAPAGEGARQGREWERARREGPRRGRGPRAAAPAAAPLAASFRWRKTLRLGVWRIVSPPSRPRAASPGLLRRPKPI